MYSTLNEGKSVIAENFIKTLKAKIYKKWQLMIANLIFLVWINYYISTINKKPIDIDYSAFAEKFETSHKAPKFKVIDRVRISVRIFLVTVTMKVGQEKYYQFDFEN